MQDLEEVDDAVYCHTCCKTLKTKKIVVTRGNWEPNFFYFPFALSQELISY